MQLQPVVRLLLIGLAAALSVIAAVQDALPLIVQALLVGVSTVLAGLGITPPQVPTRTVVHTEGRPVNVVDENGQASGRVVAALALVVLILLLAWLVHSPLLLFLLVLVALVLFV